MKLLIDGKVHAMINDRSNLKILESKHKDLKVLDEKLTTEPWGIGVKKGNKKLLDELNKQIEIHVKNGNIKKIFKKHKIPNNYEMTKVALRD